MQTPQAGKTKRKPSWVKFGPGLMELDAVYALAGTMDIPRVEAAGYIALLVTLAIRKGDDAGQINDLRDRAIEKACYWEGSPGDLMHAFANSGIFSGERDNDNNPFSIEPGLWATVAGDAIKARISARERKQDERNRQKNGHA